MNENIQTLVTLSPEQVLVRMNSSEQGLGYVDVKQRQITYGVNEITKKPYRSLIVEAISHSVNPLVAILLIAAIISASTANMVNAAIIITIIILSVSLDYFQSHRSLVAIRGLQAQIASTIDTLRDGKWGEIACRELVPGDIIRLVAGDMIPADAILITAKDLHVQQAALTGESMPVEKKAVSLGQAPQNLAESTNAVFSGSSVISGLANAVVISTGKNTLFGHIAESLKKAAPKTEFEKGIIRFGIFIMKTVFFLTIFVFVINVYFYRPLLEPLLFSIALAVGLTPELLPMITTVTLAAGAVHMSKKKVIVKNLAAIQNIGSIDILCSDKTGTLTSGEMILERYHDISGRKSESVMLLAYLNSLFGTEIVNPFNVAILKKTNINPLDAAILKHAHPDVQSYKKIAEIPFDFERRRSSVVVDKNGCRLLITKGAPEHILSLCQQYELNDKRDFLDDIARERCNAMFQSLSHQGYRVLAIAYREITNQSSYHTIDEKDLIFSGFLAFFDPPLSDIAKVIQELKQEGVSIKIITGDNDLVARHVCEQVGLDPGKILVGDDLDQMTDPTLEKLAEETRVFARISPLQKQRIISALRARGHVVGYMGDGINDAPSLHIADVGISVEGAVDVAREAADIILLKRHLRVLLNGIIEGRKSFGNVMKYLMMGTSSNFGNMLSMAGAVLFLPFLPMLPTQILLNNFLYDISQVTIPTDNVDRSFLYKPRHWNIDIIRKFMFFIGPISSVFDFLTFFVMLVVFKANESLFQTGWFVESLATQTLVIFVIRTAKNPFRSKPSLPLVAMVLLIVCIGIVLPFSPIAQFWGFVPLPLGYFLFLVSATLLYLFLVEIIKKRLMWRWLEQNA